MYTTHAYGINYSDSWGKKINVTASYFFNKTGNATGGITKRFYYLPDGTNQNFNQNNSSQSDNLNHRFNGRLEYNIDTSNSILITPQLSYQKNNSTSYTDGSTTLTDNKFLNSTTNNYSSISDAINFSNNALYNHKFKKFGRAVTLNLGANINVKNSSNDLNAINTFYTNATDSTMVVDQRTQGRSQGNIYTTNLAYTEPISKIGSLQVSYSPSWNRNTSNQLTNKYDSPTQSYRLLDPILSNNFVNNITTQSGGLSYRQKGKKYNFNVGANYQTVDLSSEQTFPLTLSVSMKFENILPTAMYQYTFDNKGNLRFFYRTSTNAPSVTQLQNVVNNTNPLSLTAGNPNLVQEYTHFIMGRYNISIVDKGKSFFIFMGGGANQNYIANSTLIAPKDTMLPQNVMLKRGSQLTKPVNLEGYWNYRTFMNYSMPIKIIKSNLNLNAGFSYTRTPGLINQVKNFGNNYNINGSAGIGSNISQKIDFNISYAPNFTIVENSIQPKLNNNYYFSNASVKANWMPWRGLVLSSDVTNTLYTGLSAAFNQNFWLWNAGIGYKFLKSQMAEIRLSVFDLLNQNNSTNRNVTETYTEDTRTQVLRRYFMLTFTYNIKKFGGGQPADKTVKP